MTIDEKMKIERMYKLHYSVYQVPTELDSKVKKVFKLPSDLSFYFISKALETFISGHGATMTSLQYISIISSH